MNEHDDTQMFIVEEDVPLSNGNSEPKKTTAASSNDTDAELLWSIDDDGMFFPLGLSNHGTGNGKTVFVTWSENYLLNFVFKKSKKTNKVQLTKVRLSIPEHPETGEQEEIREILILELNSLILMRSGCVHYFSSVKSMHPIPWLTGGVRCITKAPQGFSVIRWQEPQHRLVLEVYQDVCNLATSENTLLHSYDITYDEDNIFNCDYRDDSFSLLSQLVTEENRVCLQQLIGNCRPLADGQQVHFFSNSCNVFALIASSEGNSKAEEAMDEDTAASGDYHIELLNTYSAPVRAVHLNLHLNILLVLLQCGIIDIWYISSVARSVQRKRYTSGSSLVHYDIELSRKCLVFLVNDDKVSQLQVEIDTKADSLTIKESVKALPGIVACTWHSGIQQLVCLTANNIFHQISFDSSHFKAEPERPCYEKLGDLYELTQAKVAKLQEKSHTLKELMEMPAKLQMQTERECVQQQLIAVAHKTLLYQKLLEGQLMYSQYLPDPSTHSEDIVYVHPSHSIRIRENTLFALVHVHCQNNDIFHSAQWHYKIDYGSQSLMLHLPPTLINTKICICIPLQLQKQPLPQFKAQLMTFVACGGNFQCIALNIELRQDSQTYRHLFSTSARRLQMSLDYSIQELYSKPQKKEESERKPFVAEHQLNLPQESALKFLSTLFHFGKDKLEMSSSFDVYFLAIIVHLVYDESVHRLKLESLNPVALQYTQLYVILGLNELGYTHEVDPKGLPALMQYQCDVERCYGSQLDTVNNFGSADLHLENLRRLYAKLRLSEYLTIVKR